LRTDPLSEGLNLYTYCFNNPFNWIDPLGLCSSNDIAMEIDKCKIKCVLKTVGIEIILIGGTEVVRYGIKKLGGKLVSRFIPFFGWALTAIDLIELWYCLDVECSEDAVWLDLNPYEPMSDEEIEELKKCLEYELKAIEASRERRKREQEEDEQRRIEDEKMIKRFEDAVKEREERQREKRRSERTGRGTYNREDEMWNTENAKDVFQDWGTRL